MTRITSVLLILALFVGANKLIAGDSNSQAKQNNVDPGGRAAMTENPPKVGGDAQSLALPVQQMALWQEDPKPLPPVPPTSPSTLPTKPADSARPARPDGPAVLPRPPAEMPSIPSGPIVTVPADPALPISAVPAGPAAPAAVPAQGPNPAAAKDEKVAPVKENGPPLPFTIMDPKRDTELTVIKGRSQLLRSNIEFTRTAVVNPKICDLIQYSATEVGFVGKAIGTTQVTVWFREGNNPNVDTQPRNFVVHVVTDLSSKEPHLKQLEAEIAKLFPNSKIRLRTFGERIIVLGQARDVSEAAEILDIIRGEEIDATGKWITGPGQAERSDNGTAENEGANPRTYIAGRLANRSNRGRGGYNQDEYADRIVNMLKVPGVHQIMLRVKIAELDRTAARNFGINFATTIEFQNGTLLLQSLLNASNSNSIIGSFNNKQLNFGIHYLEQHGVVRLLSEPNLVTMSGQPANFIAGGEFAVPTAVGVNGISGFSTDFRAYGAIISFTPFLLDKDLIRLRVTPEFSQIDNGTTVNGIPGLTERTVHTTVELHAGQTLAIAGLLSDSMISNTQFDWPWIGKLLGPRTVSRSETELIVLVTPELVHPMEPEEVPPLPGFDVTEPSNTEFFWRGDIEGNPTRDYRSTVWPMLQQRYRAGGSPMISGPFGHSNPWSGESCNGAK
jgi:pilus assembly protein CpaC